MGVHLIKVVCRCRNYTLPSAKILPVILNRVNLFVHIVSFCKYLSWFYKCTFNRYRCIHIIWTYSQNTMSGIFYLVVIQFLIQIRADTKTASSCFPCILTILAYHVLDMDKWTSLGICMQNKTKQIHRQLIQGLLYWQMRESYKKKESNYKKDELNIHLFLAVWLLCISY